MQVIRKGFVKSEIETQTKNAVKTEKGYISGIQGTIYKIDTPTMNSRYVCACVGKKAI